MQLFPPKGFTYLKLSDCPQPYFLKQEMHLFAFPEIRLPPIPLFKEGSQYPLVSKHRKGDFALVTFHQTA